MSELPLPTDGTITVNELTDRIENWCQVLFAPDQVVEVRALKVTRYKGGNPRTESGYFDGSHRRQIATHAVNTTKHAKGVYVTLNPVNHSLLACRANRMDKADNGEATKDADILCRRWLLVDIDPVRHSHISASDEEKDFARQSVMTVRAFLSERGWPAPILSDSGNGYHLLYRIDLPADDGGLVQHILEALASRFDTPQAKVDQKVFNASRICKLPGTLARKGDEIPGRPHRFAQILEVPDPVAIVAREQLEALVTDLVPISATPPTPAPRSVTGSTASNGEYTSRLKVGEWLTARNVDYRVKSEPDKHGRTVYVLGQCPFDASHGDPDACVMQAADGKMSAQCFHNSCHRKGWQAFKEAIGAPAAHEYDPPLTPTKKARRPAAGEVPSNDAPGDVPSSNNRVVIHASEITVDETVGQITAALLRAGDCYNRAERAVCIHRDRIKTILNPAELAGVLNRTTEVVYVEGEDEGKYRPLPVNYANVWLHKAGELHRLPTIELYTTNPVYTRDWRHTPPGYDADTGIYYAGTEVRPRSGSEHWDTILRDFCFRTNGDRTNYLGLALTTVLMPHFIGSKPAGLFAGNQPGIGKTILAQILAILRSGKPVSTASFNQNDEEFEKRLGAIVRSGATTIIIDNAKNKANGHSQRLQSACLERTLTDEIASFRLLGKSEEIRVENSLMVLITANGPEVGPDLLSRSVVIHMYHEGDPKRREFTLDDPEGYAQEHRSALLGELLGMVERWKEAGMPRATTARSRFNKKGWGPIVGGILQVAGFEGFLDNAEEAVESMDETRRDFAELVRAMAEHPQPQWRGAELVLLASGLGLFHEMWEGKSQRGKQTLIGTLATRFVGENFRMPDGGNAVLKRDEDRDGAIYRLRVDKG